MALLTAVLAFLLLEGGAQIALRAFPSPGGAPVTFAFEDVWAHEGVPFHRRDGELLWRTIPGAERPGVRINRLGFRGREIDAAKPAGTRRLAILGNSVTFGFGVDEDETFARRLEEELRAAVPGSGAAASPVEVVNAGVIGYSSWQVRRYYPRAVGPLSPDIVVVLAGYNDHHAAVRSDAEKGRGRALGAVLSLLERTSLHRLVSRLRGVPAPPALRRRPVPRVSLDAFEENIRSLERVVRNDGAWVLFLTVPLRPVIPLVEDLRAVTLPGPGGSETVWMRQIDFALGSVGSGWHSVFREHFFGTGPIDSFAVRPENLEAVRALGRAHPELPIFPYLEARCAFAAGDTAAAAAAIRRSVAADREREEVEAYNDRLRALADRGAIELLDAAADFTGADPGMPLFLDVVHPTPAGHARLARLVARRLLGERAPRPSGRTERDATGPEPQRTMTRR